MEDELGLVVCGGKGAAFLRTPGHIMSYGEKSGFDPEPFIYASRISAKVDNTALQDGYELYHHVFILTAGGHWAVIQQGMNEDNRKVRRHHWLGEQVRSFIIEPHRAVCSDRRGSALNLVDRKSEGTREMCTLLSRKNPDRLISEISRLNDPRNAKAMTLPCRHDVSIRDIHPGRLRKVLLKTYELKPEGFESLLATPGVGPISIRALSLISEIIYGKAPSYDDPARFSFAHGGKDGTPYPVSPTVYDRTIDVMKNAIEASRVGNRDKFEAIKRFSSYFNLP